MHVYRCTYVECTDAEISRLKQDSDTWKPAAERFGSKKSSWYDTPANYYKYQKTASSSVDLHYQRIINCWFILASSHSN